MILGDADIERRLDDGDLVIEPLEDPNLQIQPASVDLRLGREFLEFNRTNIACIHPDREEEVDEYVTTTTVPPDAGDEQTTLIGYDADERRDRNEFILHPGDFVLGTTIERVEIPSDLIAHVEGRSSLGRLAIVVHASLPGDEPVFLWTPEEGFGFYEISDIVDNERSARAVSFDPRTLQVRTHQVTDYITNPTQRIYRVTLSSGRTVHVTKDHNLFTIDDHGGVARIPSEAAEGQLVMVPAKLPEPQVPESSLNLDDQSTHTDNEVRVATDGIGPPTAGHSQTTAQQSPARSRPEGKRIEVRNQASGKVIPRSLSVTGDFAWIVGFYLTNGSVRKNHLVFEHEQRQVLDRVEAWFKDFDTPLGRGKTADDHESLMVRSPRWTDLFTTLFGDGSEKALPDAVWNWSDQVVTSLVAGLTDGSIIGSTTNGCLQTASATLAYQLMYLTARLDLDSDLSKQNQEPPSNNDSTDSARSIWTIVVNGEAQRSDQTLPVPSKLLRDLRRAAGLTEQQAATAIGSAPSSKVTALETGDIDRIPRELLRRISDGYGDAGADTTRLSQLLNADVRFERVETVEQTPRVEPTYDLEVQPNGRAIENFIGGSGGIFLSNTAGIVDPGYRGQITLELSNLGTAPVALTPGMRISQLTFTELKSPARRPYGQERGSKYQDQEGPQASRIQSDHEFHGDQK